MKYKTVAILIALVLVAGCVDTSELEAKIDSLEKEKETLTKSKDDLTKEVATLRTDKDTLKADLDDYKAKYDDAAAKLESYQSAVLKVTRSATKDIENGRKIGEEYECKDHAIEGKFVLNNTGKAMAKDINIVFGAKVGEVVLWSEEKELEDIDLDSGQEIRIETKPDENLCDAFAVDIDEAYLVVKFKDERATPANYYKFQVDKAGEESELTGEEAAEGVF